MAEPIKILNHRILLRQEPEGGYTVTVPSLPGCMTYGSDISEALAMAREAIELYLESLKAHDTPFPFRQQYESATDDYTIERRQWLDHLTIDDVLDLVKAEQNDHNE